LDYRFTGSPNDLANGELLINAAKLATNEPRTRRGLNQLQEIFSFFLLDALDIEIIKTGRAVTLGDDWFYGTSNDTLTAKNTCGVTYLQT